MSGVTDPRDEQMREKLATIDLSMEARQFLGTRVGKFLALRAKAHVDMHVAQLKTMDIMGDPRAALKVQMEIANGENFMHWLAELLREGAQLTEELIAEERAQLGLDGDIPPTAT